jgi:hypothetical protein
MENIEAKNKGALIEDEDEDEDKGEEQKMLWSKDQADS